jgi:hypothetical protein
MSWDTEVLLRTADRYVLLELVLDDETLHFGHRALAEVGTYWEPWIQSMGSLQHQLDPETRRVAFSDLAVTLKNIADPETGIGYFSALLEGDTVLDGRVGNVYLAFKDASGTVFKEKMFSGLILPGDIDATTFDLSLHVPLEDRLKLLQRHATDTAFDSNLPAPVPMPVVLGTCTGASRGGPVQCIPLDLTSATKTFLVAQHAVASIGTVYRRRAGAWSTVSSGLTKVTKTADAEGHYYAKIEISSGHTDGDEYFAEVSGLMTGGYADLDGSSEYFTIASHADFSFTGDFRIELLFYRRTSSTYNYLWFKTAGGAEGVAVLLSGTEGMNIYVGGVANYISLPANSFPLLTWHHVGISYDESEAEVSVWNLNTGAQIARGSNTAQTGCTKTGTLPTTLTDGGAALSLGRNVFGGTYFDGLLGKAAAWNAEYDDGTAHLPTDTGAAAFWAFNGGPTDETGLGHTLTEVNITAADYGTTWRNPIKGTLCQNPADSLRELLMSPEGWGLSEDELDMDSFDEAATYCADAGLAAAGVWGGAIPERGGDLELADRQWELLALIARNFDHAVVPNRAGQISLKHIPTELVDPTGLVHYRQSDGDVNGTLLVIKQRPIALVNDARGIFKHAHSAEALYDKYLRAYNSVSQEFFGLTKEVQWPYRFHRDLTVLMGVIGPQLQLRSGKTREVTVTTPGLWGLQDGSDVGDVVLLSAAAVFGTFSERQILITSSSADLLQGTVTLKGLTLGDSVGAVAFSTEETEELESSLTTFVGATQNPNPDDFEDADAGAAYGAAGYLRLGHHYVTAWPGNLLNGNINWRSLLRWNLPASPWSGRTIKAVTIQLTVNSVPSLPTQIVDPPGDETYHEDDFRSGFTGGTLNIFGDDTWDGADTYNSLGGLGGYSADVGASLGSFSGGTGQKNIILDATGKQLFIDAAAGSGDGAGRDVNLCLGDFSSGDYTNAAILAAIAKAIITYTT